MKVTFFVGSVVGYVENPTAFYTRGLAHGLALRGNEIRIVEERQNLAAVRTLREVGAGASRHFYDAFQTIQHHTYEPRTGARLLEWVTREIALIEVAVAVDGVEPELCRWLANVSREGLTRASLTFQPESLTDDVAERLDLGKFDIVLAPSAIAAHLPWRRVPRTVAERDQGDDLQRWLPAGSAEHANSIEAAEAFEAAISTTRSALVD